MSLIPEGGVTSEDVATRFNLTAEEADRVLALAHAELDRVGETVWRPVPAPLWDDWTVRVCGGIVAAKKRPTAGASNGTNADQAQPRPAGSREYLAPIRAELANYTEPGLA